MMFWIIAEIVMKRVVRQVVQELYGASTETNGRK
jgi:hypothetical protein